MYFNGNDLCLVFCSIIVKSLPTSKTPQTLPWNVSLSLSLYMQLKNTLQAKSDILGIANNAAGRVGITKSTLQHPAVFGLFARWLEDNTKFDQPFPFTTITMTHGHHPSIQYFYLVVLV